MRVQVVTYTERIHQDVQNELNIRLFNESKADIILFPGRTFRRPQHVSKFSKAISNKKSLGIFELENLESRGISNVLFAVQKGIIRFSSFQLFADSDEIKNNPVLGKAFLDTLKINRSFDVSGSCVRVFQCGEINILRNVQSQNNKVKFRFEDPKMIKNFSDILNESHIILNPQHTPMGNQGKMSLRRSYLSANGRAYFSAANAPNQFALANSKAIHYAHYNGLPMERNKIQEGRFHTLFEYKIPN